MWFTNKNLQLCELYIDKNDPVVKAQVWRMKMNKETEPDLDVL